MILQLWYQEVVAAEYIATLLGRIPLQEKKPSRVKQNLIDKNEK